MLLYEPPVAVTYPLGGDAPRCRAVRRTVRKSPNEPNLTDRAAALPAHRAQVTQPLIDRLRSLEPLDAASSTANTGAPSAKPKGHRHGLRDDWQAVEHHRKNPRIGDRSPSPYENLVGAFGAAQ